MRLPVLWIRVPPFLLQAPTNLKHIDAAIKIENYKVIQEQTHKFIPSAKYIGASKLSELIEKMNVLALESKDMQSLIG
ncbi:MAG: hypothetical protein ACI8ZO_000598 [Flavobacteriales bacterium]|jgi:hypothetical protein